MISNFRKFTLKTLSTQSFQQPFSTFPSLQMIKVGDKIPSVKVMVSQNPIESGCAKPSPVMTTDVFRGKVVLFAVPGAFTPTCHLQHLPGFLENYHKFVEKGYSVYCMSTNDIFVLDAWGKSLNVGEKIKMVADGNGEFASALGAGLDLSKNLMGTNRTSRFGMILQDCVVKYFQIGNLEVSGAETLLAKI